MKEVVPIVQCVRCERIVELTKVAFMDEWRYDLAPLKGWVGVPWICPDCIRGEEVALALMEENTNG
jgi:hypothetical protein